MDSHKKRIQEKVYEPIKLSKRVLKQSDLSMSCESLPSSRMGNTKQRKSRRDRISRQSNNHEPEQFTNRVCEDLQIQEPLAYE